MQFILIKEQKTILMWYKDSETIVYLEATADLIFWKAYFRQNRFIG